MKVFETQEQESEATEPTRYVMVEEVLGGATHIVGKAIESERDGWRQIEIKMVSAYDEDTDTRYTRTFRLLPDEIDILGVLKVKD